VNIESPSKEDSDVDYWDAACAVAIKAKGEDCTGILPRVIRVHQLEDGSDMCDTTGHRIFQITPAKMDDKLVKRQGCFISIDNAIEMLWNESPFVWTFGVE
jgi:hypothetical protein